MSWLKDFIKTLYEYWFKEEVKEFEKLKEENSALKEIINNSKKIKIPKVLGTISIFELSSLLSPYCKEVYLCDKNYSLTSVEEAKEFSIETGVFTKEFVDEKHDCDNFSSALHGYWNEGLEQFAFGICWSNQHAFNILISETKQIYLVEPQSNTFFKIEDIQSNPLYFPLRMILI